MRKSKFIDHPEEKEISFQQPIVNYCGHLAAPPEYYKVLGDHVHDCTEVSICIRGGGREVLSGREYPFTAGCMVLLNPNDRHHDIPDETAPPEFLFMGIENYVFSSLPKNSIRSEGCSPILPLKGCRSDVELYFDRLIREVTSSRLYYKSLASMLAGCILTLAIREMGGLWKTSPPGHAQRVKDYIDQNYASPLNLNTISERVYISKSYLSHIFKSDVGISPMEYLIRRRMERARDLLEHTSRPISEIAAEVGYDDPDYFGQIFRRSEGVSPSAYRSRVKP